MAYTGPFSYLNEDWTITPDSNIRHRSLDSIVLHKLPLPPAFKETTQKFIEEEHMVSAMMAVNTRQYISSYDENTHTYTKTLNKDYGSTLFNVPATTSIYCGRLLSYKMAFEDWIQWDEGRELRLRHYKIRKDETDVIDCIIQERIVPFDSGTVIHWITEDVGKRQRRLVYAGRRSMIQEETAMMKKLKRNKGL